MKKFITYIVLGILISIAFVDAAFEDLERALRGWSYDDPYFYMNPVTNNTNGSWYSNNGNSGFKYYCSGSISLMVKKRNQGDVYKNITNTLIFDSHLLTYNTGSVFLNSCTAMSDISYNSAGKYTVKCVGEGDSAENYGRFIFTPNVSNGSSKIWFDFCSDDLSSCTSTFQYTGAGDTNLYFGVPNTDDVNQLQGVKGAIYDLYAWPCTKDQNAPRVTYPAGGTFTGNHYFTGIVVDASTTLWDYWFNGHDYSETGLNYEQYGNSNQTYKMDNQGGVNSSSVTVKLEYLSGNHSTVTYNSRDLSLNAWRNGNISGVGNRSSKTWNNNVRGYEVGFTGVELQPEKTVKITITASDNPNELGNTYTGSGTPITINTPTTPSITGGYNTNGSAWRTADVLPSRENEYMIILEDSPAGIDSSTVRISFADAMDASGITTPAYTLSGNDLHFTASGVSTYYNGANTKYEVRFNPAYDLLEDTTTAMTVTVVDAAGNTGTKVFNLRTRASCSSFGGCRDYLNINHFGEATNIVKLFSGLNIVVTGTDMNSIYPYLTGETLFCGSPWTGATLTPEGKMNLYTRGDAHKKDSLTITGSIQNMYKAENSDDLDYDTNKTSDSRSLVNRIDVK